MSSNITYSNEIDNALILWFSNPSTKPQYDFQSLPNNLLNNLNVVKHSIFGS